MHLTPSVYSHRLLSLCCLKCKPASWLNEQLTQHIPVTSKISQLLSKRLYVKPSGPTSAIMYCARHWLCCPSALALVFLANPSNEQATGKKQNGTCYFQASIPIVKWQAMPEFINWNSSVTWLQMKFELFFCNLKRAITYFLSSER